MRRHTSLMFAAILGVASSLSFAFAARSQTPSAEPAPTQRVEFSVVEVQGKQHAPSLACLPLRPGSRTRAPVPLRADFRAALAASAAAL